MAPSTPTPEAGAADELRKFQKRARAKFITTPLAVSLAELRTDLEKSYRNTVYCASQVVQEDGSLRSKYCGNRWCLVCSRIRTARAITAYMPVLQEWSDPHLVTLTRRNVGGDDLSGIFDEMLAAFNSCKRSIKRTEKLDFKAIRKTECTYNLRRKDYHPHYHVIVEGQVQAELLRDKWVDRYDGEADIAGQDVRPCDENTLMEVFKYFTKLTTKATTGERRITPPDALDVIFSAMRGRRVWQPVGFKLKANEDEQIESDELEVSGTPAFKRSAEKVLWEWEQDLTDWVDLRTGECLSEYRPPEKLKHFVEQAVSVEDSPVDRVGVGGNKAINDSSMHHERIDQQNPVTVSNEAEEVPRQKWPVDQCYEHYSGSGTGRDHGYSHSCHQWKREKESGEEAASDQYDDDPRPTGWIKGSNHAEYPDGSEFSDPEESESSRD